MFFFGVKNVKKTFGFVVFLWLLVLGSTIAFAHSGGTDTKGGHYDHIGGGYHYHHGYPAHDHKDGECPYVKNKNESKSDEQAEFGFFGSLLMSAFVGWFGGVIVAAVIYLLTMYLFFDWLQENFNIIMWVCSVLVGVAMFIYLYFIM